MLHEFLILTHSCPWEEVGICQHKRYQIGGDFAVVPRDCSVPQCIFTSCFILISNSVEDPQYIGTINGVTQTLTMFFRALSPTAGGSIFAWSTSQRGRFINANLWFYFVGILYAVMFLLSCLLSPRVEERKFVTEKYEEPKEENEE